MGTQLSSNLTHFQSPLPSPTGLDPFLPQSPPDQTFREQSSSEFNALLNEASGRPSFKRAASSAHGSWLTEWMQWHPILPIPQETANTDWGCGGGVSGRGRAGMKEGEGPDHFTLQGMLHTLPYADPTSRFPSRENTELRKCISLRNPPTWSPSDTAAQRRQQLPWASEQEGERVNI